MQREKESKSLQQWSFLLPHQPGPAQCHSQQQALIPVSVLSMKPSYKQLSLLARQSLLDIPDIKVFFFSTSEQLHFLNSCLASPTGAHKDRSNFPASLKQDYQDSTKPKSSNSFPSFKVGDIKSLKSHIERPPLVLDPPRTHLPV